jgi:hypothetical protein
MPPPTPDRRVKESASCYAAIAIFEELGSRIELGPTLVLRGGDNDLAPARELFQACAATGEFSSRQ